MLGAMLGNKLGSMEGVELAGDVGCNEVVGGKVVGDALGTLLKLGT